MFFNPLYTPTRVVCKQVSQLDCAGILLSMEGDCPQNPLQAVPTPGHPTNGKQVVSILKRLVEHLRGSWPNVEIIVRADSKFSSPEMHDFCEDNGIYYVLGQGANSKLKAAGQNLMDQALRLSEHKETIRLFSSFSYQAGTWRQPRRIIHKAEVTNGEANPRYLVSSAPGFSWTLR